MRSICPSLNYVSNYIQLTQIVKSIRKDFKEGKTDNNKLRRFRGLRIPNNQSTLFNTIENRKIRIGFI